MHHAGVLHPLPQKYEEKMKKIAAGATLAAAVGFSTLSATPAMALSYPFFFENCAEAASYGVYNIPVGAPGYSPNLDSDSDGIGCENAGVAYDANLVPPGNTDVIGEPVPNDAVGDPLPPVVEGPQVEQMPVGGAETGVTQESTNNTNALALGGGLALMAAAGGTYVVRRRTAQV